MDLKVTIEGLGKISKGEINLKGFTVFAGRNNTGKTFASKAIYSALKGASSNHAWNVVGEAVDTLHGVLARLHRRSKTSPPVLEELRNLAETPSQFLSFLDKDGSHYAQQVREIAADIETVYNRQNRDKMLKELGAAGSIAPETDVEIIENAVDEIKKFAKLSGKKIVQKSINEKMPHFFTDNFRSRGLDILAREPSEGWKLSIDDCLDLEIKKGRFAGRWASPSEILNIPALFFIDAVGLKINSRLIRDFSSLKSRFDMVPEIPGYHTDLINTLETVNLVPEKSLERIISNIAKSIGGKLEYDNGSLVFREDGGGVHDASVTSAGILQLGLLGLLAEKGLLIAGSFLFIDEPEANLHPGWQTLISGLLADLALKSNINIVLATHSPNIVQYLKYEAKHDDKLDLILSVNHFAGKSINVDVDDMMSNCERLQQIESALNERYMDIFMKGAVSA